MVFFYGCVTWRGCHKCGLSLRFLVLGQSFWLWCLFLFIGLLMFMQRKFKCLVQCKLCLLLPCEVMWFSLIYWIAYHIWLLFKPIRTLNLFLMKGKYLVTLLFCWLFWMGLRFFHLDETLSNNWPDYYSI